MSSSRGLDYLVHGIHHLFEETRNVFKVTLKLWKKQITLFMDKYEHDAPVWSAFKSLEVSWASFPTANMSQNLGKVKQVEGDKIRFLKKK